MIASICRGVGYCALVAVFCHSAQADDHVLWWEIWDNISVQGKGPTSFAELGVDSARVRLTAVDGTSSILPLYFQEDPYGSLTLSPYTVVEAPGWETFYASLGTTLDPTAKLALELGAWGEDEYFWCLASTPSTTVEALSGSITDADDLGFGALPVAVWKPTEFIVPTKDPSILVLPEDHSLVADISITRSTLPEAYQVGNKTDPELVAMLKAIDANGLPAWQNLLLGVDGSDADSLFVRFTKAADSKPTALKTVVGFKQGPAVTYSGVTVTCSLLSGPMGSTPTTVVKTAEKPLFTIDVPSAATAYTIQVEISK